jgi:hypothetical protein
MAGVEDVYSPEEEQSALAAVLFPRYERMLVVMHQMVQSAFPELSPDEFRLDDAATRKLLAKAGERVMLIDGATRRALQEVLQLGQARGVEGLYLNTWKSRATTIARTELSTAMVEASLDRYAATGLVTKVELVEHTGTDEPCAERNGKVVPIASHPQLEHPNCRLSVIPVVEGV